MATRGRILKLSNICAFTGCSTAAGIGLDLGHNDPGLWCNILHQNHPLLKDLKVVNSSVDGATNLEIFKQSVELLALSQPKFMFVGWTEPYRIKTNPGIETYKTGIYMAPNSIHSDVTLNHCTYPADYIANVKHRFFDLQNIHYIYLEILDYCRILRTQAELMGTKIYFVNWNFEWDDDYFDHINSNDRTPNQLTKFTQKLLHANNRDDKEIFELYDRMHQEYDKTQGLINWLNLYDGFNSKYYIDFGNDGVHPGYASHRKFAEFLITQF